MLKFTLTILGIYCLYYVVMFGYDIFMSQRKSIDGDDSIQFVEENQELAEKPKKIVVSDLPNSEKKKMIEDQKSDKVEIETEGIELDAFLAIAKDKSKLAIAGFDFD